MADELFDVDLLDEEDPFEIDAQAAHLFKHPRLGIEDIREVWASRSDVLPRQTTRPLTDGRRSRRRRPDGSPRPCPRRRPTTMSPRRLLPGLQTTRRPIPERQMNHPMTPDEEYEFYARPENQEPQGPGRRRLTATVPVRFPPELLEQVRAAAAADDRSVSSWIRRAVEHELRHPA
ncbi:YlcI/YnfO family protein [Mycobacterium simulans]|nr:YlcI/YnfO family protein [Mycobacterium simulans]